MSHAKLVRKLGKIGIDHNLLLWIKSYLSPRTQFVDMNLVLSQHLYSIGIFLNSVWLRCWRYPFSYGTTSSSTQILKWLQCEMGCFTKFLESVRFVRGTELRTANQSEEGRSPTGRRIFYTQSTTTRLNLLGRLLLLNSLRRSHTGRMPAITHICRRTKCNLCEKREKQIR